MVLFECSQGTYLNCFTLSVSVTYCTPTVFWSTVSAFYCRSSPLKRGIFLHYCQFVAPASCAACMVVHSYTFSFKGVQIVLFSESHTAHLTPPLRLRLDRSHTDVTLSCCLMSLCERNSSVSLTCFHLHMLPLLFFWLPSMPAHTDLKEKFCSLPFLYHSFHPARILLGVWGLEDIFFLKRGLTRQKNKQWTFCFVLFFDSSSFVVN